jgi:hypothetical protein
MPEAYGNDALRQKLIAAAVDFTGSLPKKKPTSGKVERR